MTQSKFDRRRMLALLGRAGGALAALGAATPESAAAAEREPANDRLEQLADRNGGRHVLSTRLTREYGVRYPFVSAGMGFVSYPPLVTAVSNAGGIGVLGNAVEPPASTQSLIRMIAEGRKISLASICCTTPRRLVLRRPTRISTFACQNA